MAYLNIKDSVINFFYPDYNLGINEGKSRLASDNRDSIVSEVDTSINERKSDLIPFLDSMDEATIYGYDIAGWIEVITLAREMIKNVYYYSLVTTTNKTLYDRNFIKITGSANSLEKICKTTLTAIVIENCLRAKEDKPLIPVLFCLTSTNCPTHLPIEVIANKKDPKANSKGSISNSELRRIYKLCNDKSLSPEVREIAKKTFLFAHVTLDNENVKAIRQTAAPWENTVEDPNRNLKWKKARKAKAVLKSSSASVNKSTLYQTGQTGLNWREWLKDPSKAHMMLA